MTERYATGIKDLPSEERPRERMIRYGPQALSNAELLAIVLRTGTRERSAIALAQQMLAQPDGLRGVANATVEELARIKGIGPVKGVQVAACVELGRRLAATNSAHERESISTPDEAAALLMPHLRDLAKETFSAILLDTKSRVIRVSMISTGTINSSVVHPREVFREAIAGSASSIIVAHNHPSGDPTPSADDRRVTARLVEAGLIVGIDVLDHVIIGDGRWVSLKERGMM